MDQPLGAQKCSSSPVRSRLTRDEGHIHVAAIRVLKHREGRPPTPEEVAKMLGSQFELTNHRLRVLQSLGIISIVENPFEAHVSIENYAALEELPEERSETALAEEVEDFQRRQVEKADELMRVFEDPTDEQEKEEKHEKLEDKLQKFRKKKAKNAPWEQKD